MTTRRGRSADGSRATARHGFRRTRGRAGATRATGGRGRCGCGRASRRGGLGGRRRSRRSAARDSIRTWSGGEAGMALTTPWRRRDTAVRQRHFDRGLHPGAQALRQLRADFSSRLKPAIVRIRHQHAVEPDLPRDAAEGQPAHGDCQHEPDDGQHEPLVGSRDAEQLVELLPALACGDGLLAKRVGEQVAASPALSVPSARPATASPRARSPLRSAFPADPGASARYLRRPGLCDRLTILFPNSNLQAKPTPAWRKQQMNVRSAMRTGAEMQNHLTVKAFDDEEFRAKLVANPHATIREEFNIELPGPHQHPGARERRERPPPGAAPRTQRRARRGAPRCQSRPVSAAAADPNRPVDRPCCGR